jgi:signal transduction histidine kinase
VPHETLADALSRTVIETGDPLMVTDASTEASRARLPALARFDQVHSLLAVPLRSRDELIGTVTAARTSAGTPYTLEDQSLLEQLTDRAGLAIHNARLHQELQAAVRVRDDFLAVAGHELRTPLAALLMQIQGLQRATQKGSAVAIDQRLGKAARSGARLERLIAQLLDVSRITAGRLRLEPELIDLSELVQEVASRFVEADAGGLSISVRSEGHVVGHWDRLRIDQVVSNLVGNAVKYGRRQPIEIVLQTEQDDALVRITDRGIGIDQEHQKKIFQRFERAVATRDFGGFGLGLWIAREIVEASGGKVEVQSTPGEGSTFTVRLPIKRSQP